MSQTEFPTDAEPNVVVRWFQIIAGAIILLAVFTIVYALALVVTGAIPFIFNYFPFRTGEVVRVCLSAAVGVWLGTTALKVIFPRVSRKAVFAILATLMIIAIVVGSVTMAINGTHDGWEGVLSSIVFIAVSASFLRGKEWDDLPGRKRG